MKYITLLIVVSLLIIPVFVFSQGVDSVTSMSKRDRVLLAISYYEIGERYQNLNKEVISKEYFEMARKIDPDIEKYMKGTLEVPPEEVIPEEFLVMLTEIEDFEKEVEQEARIEEAKKREAEELEAMRTKVVDKTYNTEDDTEEKIVKEIEDVEEITTDQELIEQKETIEEIASDSDASDDVVVFLADETSDLNEEIISTAKKTVPLRLTVDYSMTPVIYNPFENSTGNTVNGYFFLGGVVKQLTIGGAFRINYVSFDAINNSTSFNGAWMVFNWAAHLLYKPVSWFELNGGIGGSYYASAFDYNSLGTEEKDEGGLMLYSEVAFMPSRWASYKIQTRLEIFFSATTATPYFYGGGRAEFHPFFEWLTIYVEAGGQPWSYQGDFFNTISGIFVWTIGTAIDFDFKTRPGELQDMNNRIKQKKSVAAY